VVGDLLPVLGFPKGPLYQHIVTGIPYDKNLYYPYSLLVRLALEVMEVSQAIAGWFIVENPIKSHENG
jgi:hypothetical protein